MAAMSLVSCDNIAPEDRYIDVERNHSEKVVLLEEFVALQLLGSNSGLVATQIFVEARVWCNERALELLDSVGDSCLRERS